MTKRRLLTILGGLGGVVAAAAAAHALVLTARGGLGCPFAKAPDAHALEKLRRASAARMRVGGPAPARPAFGFALGATTKDDVRAWGKRGGVSCGDELGGAAIRCVGGVGGRSGPPTIDDAFFRFDPNGKLVGVDVMRQGARAADAAALFSSVEDGLTQAIGTPTAASGDLSAAALGNGQLSRASVEYRFADYAADVSATSFDGQTVVVREQYRSLN